jgi:hypothetical protein
MFAPCGRVGTSWHGLENCSIHCLTCYGMFVLCGPLFIRLDWLVQSMMNGRYIYIYIYIYLYILDESSDVCFASSSDMTDLL